MLTNLSDGSLNFGDHPGSDGETLWSVMGNALGSTNGFCTAAMSSAVVRAGRIARRAADRLNRSPAPLRIAAPAAAGRDAAEERRFIDRWPWKSDAGTACSSALSTGCRAPGAIRFTIFDLLRPHIYALSP